MILDRRQTVLAIAGAIMLATGCAAPPKAPKAAAATAPAKVEQTPAPASAPAAAPATPKDILTALQATPLKLQSGDKVWVVSAEGLKPRDVRASRTAEDALRRIASQRDKATLVEGSAPALAALLESYEAKPFAEIPDEDLIKAARTAGVTKLVLYYAKSLAAPGPGAPAFAAPPEAEEPMSLEIRVMDVASGKAISAAEVSTAPAAPAAQAASERAYPLRVTDPEYVSRPDVPKVKKDSNLLGRRYRALTLFSDELGPQGLYDNPGYQAWTRTNDQLGPFPFYSADSTLMIITTTPPNARVFVNGQDAALTPCWLPLEEGDKVVIVKEGFTSEEFRVPVERQAFHIDLHPR